MFLFDIEGVVGLALLALWIYCILDVIATDNALVRNLPKGGWIFVVLFLPDVGSIAWLLLGRPERAGFRPGDTTHRKPFSTRFVARGPDDDPNFTSRRPPDAYRLRPDADVAPADAKRSELEARERALKNKELEAWEADLARREAELKGAEPPAGPPKDENGFEGGRW